MNRLSRFILLVGILLASACGVVGAHERSQHPTFNASSISVCSADCHGHNQTLSGETRTVFSENDEKDQAPPYIVLISGAILALAYLIPRDLFRAAYIDRKLYLSFQSLRI